jgi:hypothetical protein
MSSPRNFNLLINEYDQKSINMKKTRFKRRLSLSIVILVCSSLLWNCEIEEDFVDSQAIVLEKPTKSIQRHVVSLKSIMLTNYKAFQVLTGLVKEDSEVVERSQDEYSDEHDLYYNLSKIYVIEGDTYEQFSFVVRSSNQLENQFKNYLLLTYPNEQYQQYIITYEYDAPDLDSFHPVSVEELGGSQLLTRNSACPFPQIVPNFTEVCTDYNCTGNNHAYGQLGCTCGTETNCEPAKRVCTIETTYNLVCGGGGSGGDDNDGSSEDTNNEGQTGGGDQTGGNNSGDDVPVVPLEEGTAMDRILDCMNTFSFNEPNITLPQSLVDSLQSNSRCYIPIDNFIQEKGCSPENKGFAIEAARACLNGGDVDYEEGIVYDNSFTNTKTECIHNRMKSSNNVYTTMLNNFSTSTQKKLTFSIDNSIGADWGIAKGNMQTQNDYVIIINKDRIEDNGSNLMRFVTLAHELIHAYMYDALEDAGVLTFDANGDAIISVNCPSNNVSLNSLTVKDRFVTLICAMNSAGTLSQQWTHDVFNSSVFSVQDYRQKLEDLIFNHYDWSNETPTFVTRANNVFGANWKREVSKAVSWIGLEGTIEYNNYTNSYNDPFKQAYILGAKSEVSITNNNCP